jgi:ferredoxin-NADP reductase
MGNQIVKVLSVRHTTRDVLEIKTEKPPEFNFIPGQAVEISINKKGWQKAKRPFSFTCLPQDNYLQFMVKTYPLLKGVTNELLKLSKNEELILHDVFGTISYKNEGVFIAGGAGITPFISIFRDLMTKGAIGNNKLIFANKTHEDIILLNEFKHMLGKNFINILSDEKSEEYANGFITKGFLEANIPDLSKYIYVCGPPLMMLTVKRILAQLKVDPSLIIIETA